MTAQAGEIYQTTNVATAAPAKPVDLELTTLTCPYWRVVAVTLARKAALADRLMCMLVRPSLRCASAILAIPIAYSAQTSQSHNIRVVPLSEKMCSAVPACSNSFGSPFTATSRRVHRSFCELWKSVPVSRMRQGGGNLLIPRP